MKLYSIGVFAADGILCPCNNCFVIFWQNLICAKYSYPLRLIFFIFVLKTLKRYLYFSQLILSISDCGEVLDKTLVNGVVDTNMDNTTVYSVWTYTCNEGYMFVRGSDEININCLPTGLWSASSPNPCIETGNTQIL